MEASRWASVQIRNLTSRRGPEVAASLQQVGGKMSDAQAENLQARPIHDFRP